MHHILNTPDSARFLKEFMDCKIQVWDFDGVIVESMDVKENGFVETLSYFVDGSAHHSDYVRMYHRLNGGISRKEKFSHFKTRYGLDVAVNELCQVFSELIFEKLKNVPLVDGVEKAFDLDRFRVIGSAMPQEELDFLVAQHELGKYFGFWYGGQRAKELACEAALSYAKQKGLSMADIGFVGDASSDRDIALEYSLKFYGRQHESNMHIDLGDKTFVNFKSLNRC